MLRQATFRVAYRVRCAPAIKSFSSTTTLDNDTLELDVLIVGGGVVGGTLAKQLREKIPHLQVGLVEAGSAPESVTTTGKSNFNKDAIDTPHPRSYAMSPFSLDLMSLKKSNSIIPDYYRQRLGYYDSMQVWEASQPASLIFKASDIDNDYLGAIVEDKVLTQYLWNEHLLPDADCRLFPQTTVSSIDLPTHASQGLASVYLNSTSSTNTDNKNKSSVPKQIKTHLLVAADGARSSTRQMAADPGMQLQGWKYDTQAALTFSVQLDQPHQQRAFQRFLPSGPLALLPTHDPYKSIVVWSTRPEIAQYWKRMNDNDALIRHVNELLQTGPELVQPLLHKDDPYNQLSGISLALNNLAYGIDKVLETAQYGPTMAAQETDGRQFMVPPSVNGIVSPLLSFPLSCQQVQKYATTNRLALIGDAAHTVHPLAGQGLNIGLQDVHSLVTTILKATDAGMDVATFIADDYHKDRQAQVSLTLSGIHIIQQLFEHQSSFSKHIKSFGMNAIQNIPPLRERLVQVACEGVARQ